MSDPVNKQENSKFKDARQMPAPDRKPKRRSRKKEKPILVQWKTTKLSFFNWHRDWSTFGRYKSGEVAEKAIKDDKRKYPDFYEYRVVDKA